MKKENNRHNTNATNATDDDIHKNTIPNVLNNTSCMCHKLKIIFHVIIRVMNQRIHLKK